MNLSGTDLRKLQQLAALLVITNKTTKDENTLKEIAKQFTQDQKKAKMYSNFGRKSPRKFRKSRRSRKRSNKRRKSRR